MACRLLSQIICMCHHWLAPLSAARSHHLPNHRPDVMLYLYAGYPADQPAGTMWATTCSGMRVYWLLFAYCQRMQWSKLS